MSLDTATLIWALALSAGALAWLLALRSHLRAFGEAAGRSCTGTVEVPLPPASTSKVLAHLLADGGSLLQARVEQASEALVVARVALPVAPGRGAILSDKARALLTCRLSAGFEQTSVHYELDSRDMLSGLARWSRVVLLLGLVALGVVAWLMPSLVIPSENPAIRAQVIQSIQVVHVLWPPFLLAYLGRRLRSTLELRVRDILANLPHVLLHLAAEQSEN